MMQGRFDGRYELLERLGAGESATVFLAEDLALGRRVALKQALVGGEEGGRRLRREFQLMGRLDHAHLPRVYEFGHCREEDLSYFTLEFLEGRPFDELAPELSEEELASLLAQNCRLLAYFERSGLVHGDLKPANLIVTRTEADRAFLKVIDLGLGGETGVGKRGWVRGTPRYASPSVLAGEPPTARTDLFALGASFLDVCGLWKEATAAPRSLRMPFHEILRRLTAEDPDAGYQSAEDALTDLHRAGVFETTRSWDEAFFVGRKLELTELRAFGLSMGAGRHMAVVSGEAGIGKTALLGEVQRALELKGVRILRGRAKEESGPLEAWGSVLHHLTLMAEEEGGAKPVPANRGTTEERADWIRSTLERVSAVHPAFVVLEDAQFLDEASLQVVLSLASEKRGGRWGICLVVRSGESEPKELRQLYSDPHTLLLELPILAEEESDSLLTALAPQLDQRTRKRIRRAGEGRPMLLRSAARSVLSHPDEPLEQVIHDGLPSIMAKELERRIAELDEEELAAATCWAVNVLAMPAWLMGALLEVEVSQALDLAERLEVKGVLERVRIGSEEQFDFASGALRIALEELMPEELRRTRHARALAARARQLSDHDDQGDIVPAVFRHALAIEDTQAVLRYGPEAVASYLDGHLPRAAHKMMLRLESYLDERGLVRDQRCLELCGDVFFGLGELPAARAAFESACRRCEDEGSVPEARPRLLRKLAQVLVAAGEYDKAQETLKDALGRPGDLAETALVHKALGFVARCLGRTDEAERCLRRGLQVLGEEADRPEAASLWNNLGVLSFDRSDHAEARKHWNRVLEIHRASGDRPREGTALTNVATVAMVLGRLEEAREALEAAAEIKSDTGNRRSLASTLSNLAVLERWCARFGRAIQLEEKALHIREEIGDTAGLARSQLSLAMTWLDKGSLGQALSRVQEARSVAEATGERDSVWVETIFAEATIDKTLGRVDRARRFVSEGLTVVTDVANRQAQARLRILGASLDPEPVRAEADFLAGLEELRALREPRPIGQGLLAFGESLLRSGEIERVEACAAEAQRMAAEIGFPHLEGQADLLLGRVAFARRDLEVASRHFHRALGRARELGTPELEARACAALAIYQKTLGRHARAVGWLGSTVRIYQRVVASLAAHPELQECYLAEPERADLLEALEDWLQT